MSRRSIIYISSALLCSTANAEGVAKINENLYASLGDNAILLLLVTQLGQIVWHMGKWIIDRWFREQNDKDAEVKKLKNEFGEFREEVRTDMAEIKNEIKHMAKAPNEEAILHRLADKMKVLVYEVLHEKPRGRQ